MNQVMEFMSKDHDRLDQLFSSFKAIKSEDFPQARRLFSEFKSRLTKHIRWEEELLFPRFEKESGLTGGGPTFVMKLEHRQIQSLLEKFNNKLLTGEAKTDVEDDELVGLLTSHNFKEEKILYPWIDRTLSEAERSEMIRKMEKDLPPKGKF